PGTTSYWYKNPGKPMVDAPVSTWVRGAIGVLALEQWVFTDFLGNGKKQIVGAIGGRFGWFDVGPTSPWTFTGIAPTGATTGFPWWHGIGTGDLDGDGKQDLLTGHAWFTTPEGGPRAGWWVAHPQGFAGDNLADRWGPSDMFGYDVDGDGDQDVITALDSHGYGIAWYENNKGAFTRHVIVGGAGSMAMNVGMIAPFSQPHAMVLADIDGDGLKDLVAGKSFYAHVPGMGDPDTNGTPVFYVFKLVRGANGPTWDPHLVDSEVGLGRQFAAGDLNGDGKGDIAVCSKHGVFLFFQQ
ncbi:MAG TPA: FG-GAP-like repeat-containing protein, partial [Polyangia bacterium]|nr:FG-GAP-like repeat-containing protein [Polyangia bacterium]